MIRNYRALFISCLIALPLTLSPGHLWPLPLYSGPLVRSFRVWPKFMCALIPRNGSNKPTITTNLHLLELTLEISLRPLSFTSITVPRALHRIFCKRASASRIELPSLDDEFSLLRGMQTIPYSETISRICRKFEQSRAIARAILLSNYSRRRPSKDRGRRKIREGRCRTAGRLLFDEDRKKLRKPCCPGSRTSSAKRFD